MFHIEVEKDLRTSLRDLICSSWASSVSLEILFKSRLSFNSCRSWVVKSSCAIFKDTSASVFASVSSFWCSNCRCLTFCLKNFNSLSFFSASSSIWRSLFLKIILITCDEPQWLFYLSLALASSSSLRVISQNVLILSLSNWKKFLSSLSLSFSSLIRWQNTSNCSLVIWLVSTPSMMRAWE